MIKNSVFVIFLWLSSATNAQDTLVVFDRVHNEKSTVSTFPDYWLGVYRNDRGVTWEVNKNEIQTVSHLYLSFTRSELEEKEGYDLRDGYLFGFVQDDSIPVLERNDSVYFAYSHKKVLFELKGDKGVAVKDQNTIFFYQQKDEIDGYDIAKLSLEKSVLVISYMEVDVIKDNLDNFKRKVKFQSVPQPHFLVKNISDNFELMLSINAFEEALSLPFLEKL